MQEASALFPQIIKITLEDNYTGNGITTYVKKDILDNLSPDGSKKLISLALSALQLNKIIETLEETT